MHDWERDHFPELCRSLLFSSVLDALFDMPSSKDRHPRNLKFLVCILVVSLILTIIGLTNAATDHPVQSGQCQNVAIATVVTKENGSDLRLVTDAVNLTVNFPQWFPPEVCGPDNDRCNLLTVKNNDLSFCFFSVRQGDLSGVAISKFRNDNEAGLQYVGKFVKTLPQDCALTSFHFDGRQVHVVCLNLTANESYVEVYRLTFENDITFAQLTLASDTEVIYDPPSLSDFLYATEQRSPCPRSYFTFAEGGYVVQIPLVDDFPVTVKKLDSCCQPPYRVLEYYGRNVTIQCSGPHALNYDPCNNKISKCYSKGREYPCAGLEAVAVVSGRNVYLQGSDGTKQSEDIEFPWSINPGEAQCLGVGVDCQEAVFVFILQNGSAFVLNFTSEQVTEFLTGNGSDKFKPVLLQGTGEALPLLDSSNGLALSVVNLSCPSYTTVARVPLSTRPVLIALLPMDGSHSCQCSPNTESEHVTDDPTPAPVNGTSAPVNGTSAPVNSTTSPGTDSTHESAAPTNGTSSPVNDTFATVPGITSDPSPQNGSHNGTDQPLIEVISGTDLDGNINSDTSGEGTTAVGVGGVIGITVAAVVAVALAAVLLAVVWGLYMYSCNSGGSSLSPTPRDVSPERVENQRERDGGEEEGVREGGREGEEDGVGEDGGEGEENRVGEDGGEGEEEVEGEVDPEEPVPKNQNRNTSGYDLSGPPINAVHATDRPESSDVAVGHTPAHQPRKYHRDSVATQYGERANTEESGNDLFQKGRGMP